MKTITTALGGSMSVVDEEQSAKTGKEKLTKIKIPMAVARLHIKRYKTTRYLQPILVAVTKYEDYVVALERCDDDRVHKGEIEWESQSDRNVALLDRATSQSEWYVDGVFAYSFNSSEPTVLSSTGKFVAVPVNAIKLASFWNGVNVEERSCLQFTTSSGQSAISPPIWKNLSVVGTRQLARSEEDSEENVDEVFAHQFDRIDQFLSVNLAFALKAASQINEVFGYDAIEPLALDDLMIKLRTVNLLRMPKEIKRTFDTGMKFTHAMTWLLGLMASTETLQSYMTVRSLMKYLTTKGVYRSTALEMTAIYHEGMTVDTVPMMTIHEAMSRLEDIDVTSFIANSKDNEVKAVGSLYGAE